MNKAKNGCINNNTDPKLSKENNTNNLHNSPTTTESSTQTEDIDNITKNYQTALKII